MKESVKQLLESTFMIMKMHRICWCKKTGIELFFFRVFGWIYLIHSSYILNDVFILNVCSMFMQWVFERLLLSSGRLTDLDVMFPSIVVDVQ